MTSIFQTLIDFLQFFFNPLYLLISNIVACVSDVLMSVFQYLLYFIVSALNMFIYCAGWIVDKFFLLSISGLRSLFGADGCLLQLQNYTSYTSFFTTVANYGWVGITWVQNFVNLQTVLSPFVVYFTFLVCWTGYKLLKSWIPTVSG